MTVSSGTSPPKRWVSSATSAVGLSVCTVSVPAGAEVADPGGGLGPPPDGGGGADLDEAAADDHPDAIGEGLGLVEVVGGEHDGGARPRGGRR